MVQGGLAPGADPVICSTSPSPTSTPIDSERSKHRQRSSISEQTEADSLIHLRESFQGHGADQTLAEFICGSWKGSSQSCSYFNYHGRGWARILVQVTIYRRLLIGRDGHLDQSEAYDIS